MKTANQSVELNECHNTLFRDVAGLSYAKQFLSERASHSGTRHSLLRYAYDD